MTTTISCEHIQNGLCRISTELAGIEVPIAIDACMACQQQPNPRARNHVTCSKAIYELRKANLPVPHELFSDIKGHVPNDGPGTELGKLISWLWWPRKKCGRCASRIVKMNKWGPATCRKRRWLILAWLRQSAEKHGLPFSAFAAGALVDLAISNSERKSRKAIIHRMPARNDERWAVAITTAPRKEPTLEACVDSLRMCGWEPIAFAEPGSDTVDNVFTVWNDRKKGTWHNWRDSAQWCIDNTAAEWIMTVQDDSLFHPDSKRFAEAVMWPSEDAGFVSLYTPKHYTIRLDNTIRPPGVNRIVTKSLWGACALIWPREVLKCVINHPVATGWRGASPKKTITVDGVRRRRSRSELESIYKKRRDDPSTVVNSDTAIGKILNAMDRTMWFVDPSPVQHIARFSSIGHGGNDGRRNAWRIADHGEPLCKQVPVKTKCECRV